MKISEMVRSIGTQQEVADKLGVTRKTVNKWCNGVTEPKYSQAVKLHKLAERSVNELP